MKKLLYIIFGVMGALMFIQCSDWTEMEPKFTEPVNINGEDYYKAGSTLAAYTIFNTIFNKKASCKTDVCVDMADEAYKVIEELKK